MEITREVFLLPGKSFGPFSPQLFFPMIAAMRRGATPVPVEWDLATYTESASGEPIDWVNQQIESLLRGALPAESVVVGKSLGTYAAGLIADLALPAIWLTPVLTSESVTAALSRAKAPFLLVGGTADPYWDSNMAHDLTPHVLEIWDADHGLFATGALAESARNMALLAEAAEQFLDNSIWVTSEQRAT